MKIFNFEIGRKKPNQFSLGRSLNITGGYDRFGLGFTIDEFNLFSQIKDYRTDLLNGTNWIPTDQLNAASFQYQQFLKLLKKYSTSIFNDYVRLGYVILAKIDNQIFYISPANYTKTYDCVKVHGFPRAEIFEFNDQNVFSGEHSIFKKCEPYQRLYNIALSCQKNGMYKSGFVTIISPKSPANANTLLTLQDSQVKDLEYKKSNEHGVATDDQTNIMIFKSEVNVNTITFDFAKMGIIETKKLCEEYVCSKLGVPYVLLPSSGQTYSNYEEANKILYENHSKYCEYFCSFAKDELGFDIDYKTIAEAGKGIV